LFSSLYLVRWIVYSWLYVLIVRGFGNPKKILTWLYILGTGIAIAGLLQFILYPELRNLSYLGWDPHYYRLFSTFFDPNFTGLFLVLTILLGIYLTQQGTSKWFYILEFVNATALFLTYSRSSWLAAFVCICIWIIAKKWWKAGVVLVACVVLLLGLPTPGGATLRLLRTESIYSRVSNWQETLQLISRSPIVGHGFNTLRYVHGDQSIYTPDVPISRAASGVDSSILFLLATTGIVGLITFLWICIRFVRVVPSDNKYRNLRLLALSTLAAIGFHSLFTNSAFYPWIMIWFWMTAGVVERITYDR
jgi:O-antigen ligase